MAKMAPNGQGGNGTTNVHPQPAMKVNPPGREQNCPHYASPPKGRADSEGRSDPRRGERAERETY